MRPLIIATLIFSISACATTPDTARLVTPASGDLLIWAHSDIQPNAPEQMNHYEAAFRDMATLGRIPDMAIVPGDLVHRKESPFYWAWMKKLRAASGIPHWYEIAGNHDMNDPVTYRADTGRDHHYAIKTGNVLMIFLSDEIRSAVTDISDETFRWWRNLVITNQDSIIITVTHAALAGSGLLGTVNYTMWIKDSSRFWDVLHEYRVDLWLSGHTHIPNNVRGKFTRPGRTRTLFIDVSSIHKSRFSPIESWLLLLHDGSDVLSAVPRNHETRTFYRKFGTTHRLPFPYHKGDGVPRLIDSLPRPGLPRVQG